MTKPKKPMLRRNLTIDDDSYELLKRIGDGIYSRGCREAADWWDKTRAATTLTGIADRKGSAIMVGDLVLMEGDTFPTLIIELDKQHLALEMICSPSGLISGVVKPVSDLYQDLKDGVKLGNICNKGDLSIEPYARLLMNMKKGGGNE